MSTVQHIARHVLPPAVYNAVRDRSQHWLMRCPCGHETSVWEMGGLRWKADGKSVRWGRCAKCGERYVGQIYRRRERHDPQAVTEGRSETMNPVDEATSDAAPAQPIVVERPGTMVRLWIDGVGCWLVWPSACLTLGGPMEPGSTQSAADLCLMANLSRRHAVIERTGEAYRLQTVAGAVNGRTAGGETFLRDGDLVTLGQNVHLLFRQPSVLSASATLTPQTSSWPRMFSGRQTPGSVDGVVLMEEVCLMGPGQDVHIHCPDWDEQVILHRRDGQLWCRTTALAQKDSRIVNEPAALTDGALVSGEGWRFRAELVGQ